MFPVQTKRTCFMFRWRTGKIAAATPASQSPPVISALVHCPADGYEPSRPMSDVPDRWAFLQTAWRFACVLTGSPQGAAKVFKDAVQEILRQHGCREPRPGGTPFLHDPSPPVPEASGVVRSEGAHREPSPSRRTWPQRARAPLSRGASGLGYPAAPPSRRPPSGPTISRTPATR